MIYLRELLAPEARSLKGEARTRKPGARSPVVKRSGVPHLCWRPAACLGY